MGRHAIEIDTDTSIGEGRLSAALSMSFGAKFDNVGLLRLISEGRLRTTSRINPDRFRRRRGCEQNVMGNRRGLGAGKAIFRS